MSPEMVSAMDLETILGGAKLVYFDGRLTEAAIEVAKAARQRGIPCLGERAPGVRDLQAGQCTRLECFHGSL